VSADLKCHLLAMSETSTQSVARYLAPIHSNTCMLGVFCALQPLFIMDGKYRLNVEEKRQQGASGPIRGSPRGGYRGYPSSRGGSGRGGWRGRGRGVRSYGPGRSSDDDNSGDEPLSH